MNDIVQRLRGEYRIKIADGLGPAGGEEPDNPNEFVRTFETPPIQKEAALEIEHLRQLVKELILANKPPYDQDILDDPEEDEDEDPRSLAEYVSDIMTETSPSWGYRFSKMLTALGLNFGTAEDLDWAIMRDIHRRIRWDEDAVKAVNEDRDWPPVDWKP